jgi:hypothetical protein
MYFPHHHPLACPSPPHPPPASPEAPRAPFQIPRNFLDIFASQMLGLIRWILRRGFGFPGRLPQEVAARPKKLQIFSSIEQRT